ncbi:MAG TPA: response regulator transcription factor [Terriglobales bacterium]|jgi:two-component system, NarL family, response regulator DevR|nr:response regulator transcription factor [Terriglobales bacterium]
MSSPDNALLLSKISVYLLAENRLLREALARILGKKNDIAVVGSSPFSAKAMEDVAAATPDVLLFDCMSFSSCESSVIPCLRKIIPGLRIVMIGMECDRDVFLRAVREGAVGYVLKDASALEVAAAVRAVIDGEAVCPPALTLTLFEYVCQQTRLMPNFRTKQQLGLTRREQQLVEMIGRGLTNKEIAQQLNVAEQTVKNHVHRMLRKVGVSDRLAVVDLCRTQGLVA